MTSDKDRTPGATGGDPRREPRDGGRDGLGDALKSVYGDMLDEAIPPEMLALLGKLS